MRRALLPLAALILLGALLLGERTARLRQARAAVALALEGPQRFVDMGVVLRVVRRDPERGKEYLRGKPPLVILREHRRGGMVDTTARPHRFVGPSVNPIVWYCSEQAEESILHTGETPLRILMYGAMGAGKTTSLIQWAGLRAIEATGLGGELGLTAPTNDRATMIRQAVIDMFPRHWWTWKERDHTFTLANGITLRLVSTHQQSHAEGSRIQGWNWFAVGSDEIQNSLAVDGDIEARGRDAPGGRFLRFNTATAMDSPDWRTWRDRILSTSVWTERRMSGLDSPFSFPEYWAQLAQTLTPREYQRKVLAVDVGPERQVYSTFERAHNLTPVPRIGAKDVTHEVLKQYVTGKRATALVGYDPGTLFDVSVILKAYRLPGAAKHVWFVVDEVTTERSTVEQHTVQLTRVLRERWDINPTDPYGDTALVRMDPYGNNDSRPHRGVQTTLRNHHLDARPAAYKPGSDEPGKILKQARIDMLCRLFCNAVGERRLFIACDDRRTPAAPRLVDALERSEYDAAGEAETQRKDVTDLSHWCAALGYSLWSLERVRFDPIREAVS